MFMNLPDTLIQYVKKMISPPDKEAIVIDLNTFNPEDYEENTIPGAIVQGQPTQEQTDAIYRILAPGAHLVAVGDEAQPYNSSAVSSFEDVGFEVRDCILYARDPDKVHYVSKTSRSEREEGCESLPARAGFELLEREEGSAGVNNPRAGAGRTNSFVRNTHPTVKPMALMRQLVKRSKGNILDPFNGSGSTGLAAIYEGNNYQGIDLSEEYIKISKARMEHHSNLLRKRYVFSTPEYKEDNVSNGDEGLDFS
jgi:DNA modification methylase